MVLAPVSEIWGRYYVFAVAGVVLVAFQIACPLVPNLAGLLAARFLVGSGASVFSSVVGGVLADLWAREERNTPMALFSGFVLGGTGAGPLVAGGIMFSMGETTAAWKWTFWHQVISTGILLVSLLVFFRETRALLLCGWSEGLIASLRRKDRHDAKVDTITACSCSREMFPARRALLTGPESNSPMFA